LKQTFSIFIFDILGLESEQKQEDSHNELLHKTVDMLLQIRQEAKKNKDFAKSDEIRNTLTSLGVVIKDTKDGFEWEIN